jgi:hypothetical protein
LPEFHVRRTETFEELAQCDGIREFLGRASRSLDGGKVLEGTGYGDVGLEGAGRCRARTGIVRRSDDVAEE